MYKHYVVCPIADYLCNKEVAVYNSFAMNYNILSLMFELRRFIFSADLLKSIALNDLFLSIFVAFLIAN